MNQIVIKQQSKILIQQSVFVFGFYQERKTKESIMIRLKDLWQMRFLFPLKWFLFQQYKKIKDSDQLLQKWLFKLEQNLVSFLGQLMIFHSRIFQQWFLESIWLKLKVQKESKFLELLQQQIQVSPNIIVFLKWLKHLLNNQFMSVYNSRFSISKKQTKFIL